MLDSDDGMSDCVISSITSISSISISSSVVAGAITSISVESISIRSGVSFTLLPLGLHGTISGINGGDGSVGAVLGHNILAFVLIGDFNGFVDDVLTLLLNLGRALLDGDSLLLCGAFG